MEKIPPGESFCIKKPHLDGMEKIPIEVCPVVNIYSKGVSRNPSFSLSIVKVRWI